MEDIKLIENILDIRLPEKYINFITEDKRRNSKNIAVNTKEETIIIKSFLDFSRNSENSILKIYGENRNLMLDGIVPIADVGYGDYICL